MSLKLWMPLTEDMRNLGLYGTNTEANGGIFENSGKLGKCLKTSEAINTGLPYTEWDYSTDSITMCCWVKFNLTELRTALPSSIVTSIATTPTGNLLGYNSYGGLALIWSVNDVYSSGLVNNIWLTGCYRTSGSTKATSSYTVPFDTWTHVALVFNKSIKEILLYINGSAYGSAGSLPDSTPALQKNFRINIGAVCNGKGPGRSIPCRINDVRVYDLALTLQEIKEISKGLVLHYPLNNWQISRSKCSNVNWNLLAKNGDFSTWSSTVSDWSKKACTVSKIEEGGIKITKTSTDSGGSIYQTINIANGHKFYYSLDIIELSITGSAHNVYVGFASSSTSGYNNSYNTIGHKRLVITKSNDRTIFVVRVGTGNGTDVNSYTIVKNLKIVDLTIMFGEGNEPSTAEEFETMFSDSYYPYDSGTIKNLFISSLPDSSGYNNNGTITGTLTTSTDTLRYDKSAVFSNDAYISAGKTHTALLDEYTISAWINPSTDDTSQHIFISCKQVGGILLRIENKLFKHIVYLDNEYAINTGTTTITPNTWYHVVGIFKNGVGIKLYVNGVKESEVLNSGTLTYNSTIDLMIGNEPNSSNLADTGYSFSGKISDVRLYSTALSEQDIKDLYQEAAFIDHKGNIGCYLFYEDADSQITKTGQALSEEFEEISDLSDGVAKVYELKIECNQLIEI